MYKTYCYTVIGRDSFNDIETVLLEHRNAVWNDMAAAHNRYINAVVAAAPQNIQDAVEESRRASSNRQAKAALKPWRDWAKEHVKDVIKRHHGIYVREIKDILEQSGIWWPNKEILADQQSRSHKQLNLLMRHMAMRHGVSKGRFAFRYHEAGTSAELMEQDKGPVIIRHIDKDRYCLRLALDKAPYSRTEAVYTEWEFIMHRPIPKNEAVVIVSVNGEVKDGQWEGKVTFTVEASARQTESDLVVGLDLGWRVGEEGLLCATAAFGGDVYRRLYLPPDWMAKWQYLEDLSAELNRSAPQKPWTTCNDAEWLESTKSLRREWRNLDRRLRRSRDVYYNAFAKELCKIAGVVVGEKMNYERLAMIQSPEVRKQQHIAAPSTMVRLLRKHCLQNGVSYREHPSSHVTVKCHQCGIINKPSRVHVPTCVGCGTAIDRDANAADNLRNMEISLINAQEI